VQLALLVLDCRRIKPSVTETLVSTLSTEKQNTHPLWDPAWATHKLEITHKRQIELGDELVRYGADLLLRALQSAPDDLPDHAVLCVLFRDAVAALDGCMHALKGAAVAAAHMHARGQLEAQWGLMLALQDPAKWGRHLYVASRREQRFRAACHVPGTQEYKAYTDARAMIEAGGGKASDDPDYAQYVASLDRALGKPENAPIERAFADFQKRHRRPAPWYYDPSAPEPLRSIGAMARFVGCKGEYDSLYRDLSHYVHGAFTGISLKYDEKGVALAPIRIPEGWRQLFMFSVSIACGSFRRVINHYRPGEVDTFVRNAERWRTIIESTPDVEVVLGRIVNA
jgi:hypothetical protein